MPIELDFVERQRTQIASITGYTDLIYISRGDQFVTECKNCKSYSDWFHLYKNEKLCVHCVHSNNENRPKLYKYFMTFTKKPDRSNVELENNFEKFLSRSETLRITRLWYTKEHWEGSNPHIHCYIECNKSLTRSRYKHYETVGHIDKQKAKGNLEEIEDYMTKENPIKKYIS